MAQLPARSIHEAAGRCTAGLLTDGSPPSGSFPPIAGQWLVQTVPENSSFTVAGPCRNHTGFPILSAAPSYGTAEHRTLFCFR